MVYHELLKPGEMITAIRYKQQLMKLNQALKKRPKYAKRHDKLILLNDNARPHVGKPVKKYIQDINWEVLPYPPYSLDIAPSDYHFFRAIQNDLSPEHFKSFEDTEKWIASKSNDFYCRKEQYFE